MFPIDVRQHHDSFYNGVPVKCGEIVRVFFCINLAATSTRREHFELVAEVKVPAPWGEQSLERAYFQCQHINSIWFEQDYAVKLWKTPLRSASIGDLFQLPGWKAADNNFFQVARMGFKPFTFADHWFLMNDPGGQYDQEDDDVLN